MKLVLLWMLSWSTLVKMIRADHEDRDAPALLGTEDDYDMVVLNETVYYDASEYSTTASFDEMIAVRPENTSWATLKSGLRLHYKEHGNVDSPNKIIMIMGIYMSKIAWELIISR